MVGICRVTSTLRLQHEPVFMAKKLKEAKVPQIKSKEDKLIEENARLRKDLEYSELRNEALNEVLKIGREQYGIDLLKKTGAKQ